MLWWISRQFHRNPMITSRDCDAPTTTLPYVSDNVLMEHQEKHGPPSRIIHEVHYYQPAAQRGHLDFFQLPLLPDGFHQPRALASSWNVLRWWLELAYWKQKTKITKHIDTKKIENPTEKRKGRFPYHLETSIWTSIGSTRRSSCRVPSQSLGIWRCQWFPTHRRDVARVATLRCGHPVSDILHLLQL